MAERDNSLEGLAARVRFLETSQSRYSISRAGPIAESILDRLLHSGEDPVLAVEKAWAAVRAFEAEAAKPGPDATK